MTEARQQITRIGAYGLIMQNEKILLCRLSSQVTGSVGMWTLPGGGIDFGEDPAAAMEREVMEETGLSAVAQELAAVDSICAVVGEGIERHSVRIIYHATCEPGELIFEQGGSTDQCRWFSYVEVSELPLVTLAEAGMRLAYSKHTT